MKNQLTKLNPAEMFKGFLLLFLGSAWAFIVLCLWSPLVFMFIQVQIKIWNWVSACFN
jgi:hypothetical protein